MATLVQKFRAAERYIRACDKHEPGNLESTLDLQLKHVVRTLNGLAEIDLHTGTELMEALDDDRSLFIAYHRSEIYKFLKCRMEDEENIASSRSRTIVAEAPLLVQIPTATHMGRDPVHR